MTKAPVASTTVEHLVVARGVQPVAKGDVLVGTCPFHEGKAKLILDPKANTWSCTKCGDYTVEPKLWKIRDTLTANTISQVAYYLESCKKLGQEVTDVEYDHVMAFFT